MLNSELRLYTNEQLSAYTNYELSVLSSLSAPVEKYVINRTYADVERWRELRDKGWLRMSDEEKMEWMGTILPTPTASKGMYTSRDLNRVEMAVETLSDTLKSLGYLKSDVSVKTDWTYEDDFWRTDMARYLGNISTLRNSIGLKWDTPTAPRVTDVFDYEAANCVEKILMDIDDVTTKLTKSWQYTGDIFSGEV